MFTITSARLGTKAREMEMPAVRKTKDGIKVTLKGLSPVAVAWDAIGYTVRFDANGGSGSMEDETGVSGSYTLPECGFTAPEGKRFKAWSIGGKEYKAGSKLAVSKDTEASAVWEDVPAHVHKLELVKAKKASCTKKGNTAYYVCSNCGKWYEDATGLVELKDKSSVEIKALGHKWDKGTVTKEATATEEGEMTYICLRDKSHTRTEVIPKTTGGGSGGSGGSGSSGSSGGSGESGCSGGSSGSGGGSYRIGSAVAFGSQAASGEWIRRDEETWQYRNSDGIMVQAWKYLPYNGVATSN